MEIEKSIQMFTSISIAAPKVPVEIRECFEIKPESQGDFLLRMKDFLGISEALILSTCNRCEIHYTGSFDPNKVVSFWCSFLGIAKSDYSSYFEIYENEDALYHLSEVSVGLKSQAIGDQQIINQIKAAYNCSVEHNMAGPFLHRLLHTIFHTNKSVSTETDFKQGSASISYSTKLMIDELTNREKEAKILIVGVGEIGEDVVKNLVKSGYKNLTLINRTIAKSIRLAKDHDLTFSNFEDLLGELDKNDIIISSIRPDEYIITSEMVGSLPENKKRIFFDLSVPRSIEPDLKTLNDTRLFTIDQIKSRVDETLKSRLSCTPLVNTIIRKNIEEFVHWVKELEVVPIIKEFKAALESIRLNELNRVAKKYKGHDLAQSLITEISQSMINKIVKLPTITLKNACLRGEKENLVSALKELFELEVQVKSDER